MEKTTNKYRIESTRLQSWDYGSNAAYFITICTKEKRCYLGDIINNVMYLSEIGKIADKYWLEIPAHFPFVKLGEYIIMPNHVHGIIIIDKVETGSGNKKDFSVETQNFASLHYPDQKTDKPQNKFGPQSKNLASIIRGYKAGVKKYATINNINFGWQSRYHDHIIRDFESYIRISQYINDNLQNWKFDKLNIVQKD